MAEPPVLAGAVQARSIWDGPLAVAASPVGAPGVVREMSLTLTSVPAVQEMPVLTQIRLAPSDPGMPSEKAREVVPSTRTRVSASVKTPVEVICRLPTASSIIPMVWSVEPSVKSLSERTAVLLHATAGLSSVLLQPRAPKPKSWGVRVALQISVWACAGAARASSAVAASRASSPLAGAVRRALGRAPAPAARPSGSDAHSMSVSHSLTSRPAPGPDRTIPAAKAPGALRAACQASPAVRTKFILRIMANIV